MFQRLGRHLFTLLCAGEASPSSSSSSEKRSHAWTMDEIFCHTAMLVSKIFWNVQKLMWNCRATTWQRCWIPGTDWEGLRCIMLPARKQVSIVCREGEEWVPRQKFKWGRWTCISMTFYQGLSYISNLLKAGANIDAQDHSGMTPLHLACRFGNISLVEICLHRCSVIILMVMVTNPTPAEFF